MVNKGQDLHFCDERRHFIELGSKAAVAVRPKPIVEGEGLWRGRTVTAASTDYISHH